MPTIKKLISQEKLRQQRTLMMIPSENYTYPEVRRAVGSVLMHKYAEGYPGHRYYQGMRFVDQIEKLAQERVKRLFGVPHANVQPYSGSPANAAVYFALLKPGDTIMGLALDHGGHLTHGYPRITFSGRYFHSLQYRIAKNRPPWFDFTQLARVVRREKPKVIVVGTTAFPRRLPWKKFAQLAALVNAYLLADISHVAGLVVAGVCPSPVRWVDIVMTTTHKTLRGPRGAILMVTKKGLRHDSKLAWKINRAIFPGLQGGPHLGVIAGIAIMAKKAAQSEFHRYGQQVVANAKILARELKKRGWRLVTSGTDNHLLVADLHPLTVDGKTAAVRLEEAGIIVNANAIPNDPQPPFRPSGIRLGTPALTARGMGEKEMVIIADWLNQAVRSNDNQLHSQIAQKVKKLCRQYPIDLD